MASASDDAANGGYEKRARDCTTVFTVESTPIARTRRGKSAPRIRCTRTDGVVHGSCSRELFAEGEHIERFLCAGVPVLRHTKNRLSSPERRTTAALAQHEYQVGAGLPLSCCNTS